MSSFRVGGRCQGAVLAYAVAGVLIGTGAVPAHAACLLNGAPVPCDATIGSGEDGLQVTIEVGSHLLPAAGNGIDAGSGATIVIDGEVGGASAIRLNGNDGNVVTNNGTTGGSDWGIWVNAGRQPATSATRIVNNGTFNGGIADVYVDENG